MTALVTPVPGPSGRERGVVRFADLTSLDRALRALGFAPASKMAFGPPGGWQVFYKNGIVVVRIKTKGDAQGPRTGQPHLSVGVTDGQGDKWFNDLAKFNLHGQLAAKAISSADRFKPTDHDNNPQRFVMIPGGKSEQALAKAGKQLGDVLDAWADRTHFPFPPGFSDQGVGAIV